MLHLLMPAFLERWLLTGIKWIFQKIFPLYNSEIGCSLSIIALFMVWQDGGLTGIPQFIQTAYRAGLGHALIACVLLFTGVAGLIIPYVSLVQRISHNATKFAVAFATFVLICGECWMASEACLKIYTGSRIGGVSIDLMFGIIALIEMSVLIPGCFLVLGSDLNESQFVVQSSLFYTIQNIAITFIVLGVHVVYKWKSVPQTALMLVHVLFLLTVVRLRLTAISSAPVDFGGTGDR